ncbi:MAG: hypothetical protein H0V17_36185 [Deltaproteobacteria bacterium]|nr:hypothetical protein [Deltaproteobacteria bacterium]
MPAPTFSHLDAADTRQIADEMAADAARQRLQPRITNAQFVLGVLLVAIAFAVFAYFVLW